MQAETTEVRTVIFEGIGRDEDLFPVTRETRPRRCARERSTSVHITGLEDYTAKVRVTWADDFHDAENSEFVRASLDFITPDGWTISVVLGVFGLSFPNVLRSKAEHELRRILAYFKVDESKRHEAAAVKGLLAAGQHIQAYLDDPDGSDQGPIWEAQDAIGAALDELDVEYEFETDSDEGDDDEA